MLHADTQRADSGLVRGVPKHSVRPVVDGIVTGLPRTAKPALGTPVEMCHASATKVPHAAFGSGIFGEGAGPAKHSAAPHSAAAPEKKGRGRPRKDAMKEAK